MRRLVLPILLMLSACAELPKPASEPVDERKVEGAVAQPQETGESPTFKNSTLKYLAKRNLKPQPTRPLNVKSSCSHKDAVGTRTRLDLLVREAEVKKLSLDVDIKGRGACHFDLGQFQQEARLPQVLLRHQKQSGCTLRMWEQGNEVTLAFNSCPKACEGQAFDYLWPVIVDARNGRCH